MEISATGIDLDMDLLFENKIFFIAYFPSYKEHLGIGITTYLVLDSQKIKISTKRQLRERDPLPLALYSLVKFCSGCAKGIYFPMKCFRVPFKMESAV